MRGQAARLRRPGQRGAGQGGAYDEVGVLVADAGPAQAAEVELEALVLLCLEDDPRVEDGLPED